MWPLKFLTIIGVGYCVIGSGIDVFTRMRNGIPLCSKCSCFGNRIACKHLNSSEDLLNYYGPDVKFLSIEESTLDLEQRYLLKFKNTSSVIIFSNNLGNNISTGSLSNVINLNLYNNSLKSIDDNFFRCNKKLVNLNLEHNDISFIAENAFETQQRLITLRLSHNNLSQLLPNIFVGLTSLIELDLSNNRIQRLEERTLAPLVAIKHFNISDNVLENLDKSALGRLSTLQILDASDNRIRHIDSDTFASLKSLKVLSLRNNLLEEVEEGTWSGLSALEELDLGGNKLQRVAAHAFCPLQRLRVLILRDNLLEEVEEGAWSGLEASLEELDLSGNRLLRAEGALASAQAPLRVLRLGRNNITSFGPALVEALAQRPALSAQLRPNPLRCACGELRDAWVEADAQDLLGDLVCASGRPWGAAMRNLTCGDASDVEDQDADDPEHGGVVEEVKPDTTVAAAIVTEESPHLQTNSPKNEDVSSTTFTVGAVIVTLEVNDTDHNSIMPQNYNITFSPQNPEISRIFINKQATTKDANIVVDIEFAVVFFVCIVALAFCIAFAVVIALYLQTKNDFPPLNERNRLIMVE